MRAAIVDYNAGNLRSVETAVRRVGYEFQVVSRPESLKDADKLVFPGVGDAAAAMAVLERTGLAQALREYYSGGRPMLGICIGAQIVLDRSEENNASCLGLIPGVARRLPGGEGRKVPHIGWNQVRYRDDHWLFKGIPQDKSFYFVHSYYPDPAEPTARLCRTEYGVPFASGIERENLIAVQFHPEKSGEFGLRVLANFLAH